MRNGGVFRVRQVFHAEIFFGLGDAGGGQGHGPGLFVCEVIAVVVILDLLFVGLGKDLFPKGGHEIIRHFVELGGIFALAGNDQRGPGLVDQNGVHLIHNGEGVFPLDQFLLINGHVVPQVVKAKLIVGAVGDVGGVALPALVGVHAGNDEAHTQAQVTVHLAHPLALVLGQIVVDGDDVDPPARQGVQVGRQGGNQGLTFAGFHLGNTALMQNNAAHQLHGIGPQAQHPVRCLPDGGKCLRRLALGKPVLEFGGLGLQIGLGEVLVSVLHAENFIHSRLDLTDLPLGAGAENFRKQSHRWSPFPLQCP